MGRNFHCLLALFHRMVMQHKRQLIISTHRWEMLSDPGIGGEEALLLSPEPNGTELHVASSKKDIRVLLESGLSVADAVMPRTAPKGFTTPGENLWDAF